MAAIDPGHMTDDETQPAKKQKGGKYPKGVSKTGRKTIRFQARVGYKPSPRPTWLPPNPSHSLRPLDI